MRITKLNQIGDHVVIIAVFIVLFGVAGTFFLLQNHAATSYMEVRMGSGCIGGTTLVGCSTSNNADEFVAWTSSGALRNANGQCLDDWNHATGTNPKNRVPMRVNTCYSGDANQEWRHSGGELINVAGGGCINGLGNGTSPGTELIIYTCNGSPNEQFSFVNISSGNGGNGGGSGGGGYSSPLNAALSFQGVPYLSGGGHSWSSFLSNCLHGNRGARPNPNNANCQVDCSGLVSMAIDMALGTNYSWFVDGSGVMQGTGSSRWHAVIPMSNVRPGDIVTFSGHVEFVYSGNNPNGNMRTMGAHNPDNLRLDGIVSANGFGYTSAYRYE